MTERTKYTWATTGDLNAFFGLMLDNVANLVVLTGILSGVFGFPACFVFTHMIPGTALGVLFGDLVYTWMAFRLAKRTGRSDVTAMPLGLDTPSTIGIAFAVLGPVYLQSHDPMVTWQVGMATMVFMGIIKLGFSFAGNWIQKIVPQAGLPRASRAWTTRVRVALTGVTTALVHTLFNVLGIAIWYPLRRVPINLARRVAWTASRSRRRVVLFVAGYFAAYLIPLALLLLLR